MGKRFRFILVLAGCLSVVDELWAQQKISILGDSYSTFYGYVTPATNLCWYGVPGEVKENDVTQVEETWWYQLMDGEKFCLECNNSYSGSTVCNTGYDKADYSDRSFIARMDDLGNPDVILVFGATNDSWAEVPLGDFVYGDWTTASLYKFRPAFSYMLNYLVTHYPSASIYQITNTELSAEITASIEEICRYYQVVNIRLSDVDKQWGHPSVSGMASICRQVRAILVLAVEKSAIF